MLAGKCGECIVWESKGIQRISACECYVLVFQLVVVRLCLQLVRCVSVEHQACRINGWLTWMTDCESIEREDDERRNAVDLVLQADTRLR
jgi:hypothetical protein